MGAVMKVYTEYRKLPDAPEDVTEYRWCVDALIWTLDGLRKTQRMLQSGMTLSDNRNYAVRLLAIDIRWTQKAADELCGRLYERYIDDSG